jgi:hypothetical protein
MKPLDFHIAAPRVRGPLAVFPVLRTAPPASRYRLLDEALEEGLIEITEIDDEGAVPVLRVENGSADPILLLEGDLLGGAKQNRVLNATLIVPGRTRMTVPVSCIEMGRWERASERFSLTGHKVPRDVHAALKRSVVQSAREGDGFRSDQCEVWNRVDRTLTDHGVESDTRALDATFTGRAERLAEFEADLPYPEGAVGLVVSLGSHVVGAEVFDSAATCRRVWRRIVSSFSLDALLTRAHDRRPSRTAVLRWLESVGGWASAPRLGLGERFFAETDAVTATLLLDEDELVHASYVAEAA